jgi:ABC-type multidrug transport system fused ATPase/permease subunit
MTAGRTAVIIAHRLSTVRHCDRILVVHHGQIMEDGTHAQLFAQQGMYYRLCTRQFQEMTDLVEKAESAS